MKSLFLLFVMSFSLFAEACTTFVIKNENTLLFGRNLDWVSDGGIVVTNLRNTKKTALVFSPDKPISWVSKFGSVTFNQFGKEFPFGGMNEKGLVVELMVVKGEYPKLDDRKALNELQWVQYQLDNHSSIEEVLASDKKIRISGIDQNLHFLVCDAEGKVAVIEFNKNGMRSYNGNNLPHPVLENETYRVSLAQNAQRKPCRFNTVVNALENVPNQNTLEYAFETLDKVALDGSWSIVYDIKNMRIHFKSKSQPLLKSFSLKSFNWDCNETNLYVDINAKSKGSIDPEFQPLSKTTNTSTFYSAVKSNQIKLPKDILQQFSEYSASCLCTN